MDHFWLGSTISRHDAQVAGDQAHSLVKLLRALERRVRRLAVAEGDGP
jgi:hypothetical protein